RLDQLGPVVHHERAVGGYRLPDGAPTEEQHLELVGAAVLLGIGGHRDHVARAEDGQTTGLDRTALGAGGARAGAYVRQRVVVAWPGQPQFGTRGDAGVHDGDVGVGGTRTVVAGHVAGDDPHEGPAVLRAQQPHLAGPDVLVARRRHLEPGREVHPEL